MYAIEEEFRCPLTVIYSTANGDVHIGSAAPVVDIDEDHKFKSQNISQPGLLKYIYIYCIIIGIHLLCGGGGMTPTILF
jgi:hypothetical protein